MSVYDKNNIQWLLEHGFYKDVRETLYVPTYTNGYMWVWADLFNEHKCFVRYDGKLYEYTDFEGVKDVITRFNKKEPDTTSSVAA